MSVIQTNNNMVVGIIGGFSSTFDIAITSDGGTAYITNFGSNNFVSFGTDVSVVDLNLGSIVVSIDFGIQPASVTITPDGSLAYVTNYNTLYAGPDFTDLTSGQGTVNSIDIMNNVVVSPTIAVDQSSAGIAIFLNGEFVYVTNYTSNTVNVIVLQSFNIVSAKGCHIKDKREKEIINKLTWKVVESSLPVSFSIYRDAALTDLVVALPGTA